VSDSPDGFEMVEAVLRHAEQHLLIVLAGMQRVEHVWGENSEGTASVSLVVFPAQNVGGEDIWQIEVKHCLEDIRSALDYTAFEVYERVCCREPKTETPHVHDDVSFPIPRSKETPDLFRKRIDRCIPGLSGKSKVTFEKILEIASWPEGQNSYLPSLEENWNIVKHRHLPRPVRKKATLVAATGGVPPGFPETEVRLFSMSPPHEVGSTLRNCIGISRGVVQTIKETLPSK